MATAMLLRRWAFCLVALSCARCASPRRPSYVAVPKVLSQGGLLQVLDATGYLSYQTPTPKDLPGYRFVRRARGEVCQNDLHLPLALEGSHANTALSGAQTLDIAWGNAAVAQGVADAMSGAPVGAVLYDLTLDLHQMSVLGLFFRRQCLVVSGSLALPWAAPRKTPAPGAVPKDRPVVQEAGPAAPKAPPLPLPAAELQMPQELPLAPLPGPEPAQVDPMPRPNQRRHGSRTPPAHKGRSSHGHGHSKKTRKHNNQL